MQLTNKNHDINELSILVLKDGFSFCTQEQTFAFPFEHNLPKESDIQTFVSSQNIPTENVQVFFAMGFQDAEYVDLPTGCVVPNTSFAAFDENCVKAWPKRTPDETYTLGRDGSW